MPLEVRKNLSCIAAYYTDNQNETNLTIYGESINFTRTVYPNSEFNFSVFYYTGGRKLLMAFESLTKLNYSIDYYDIWNGVENFLIQVSKIESKF